MMRRTGQWLTVHPPIAGIPFSILSDERAGALSTSREELQRWLTPRVARCHQSDHAGIVSRSWRPLRAGESWARLLCRVAGQVRQTGKPVLPAWLDLRPKSFNLVAQSPGPGWCRSDRITLTIARAHSPCPIRIGQAPGQLVRRSAGSSCPLVP